MAEITLYFAINIVRPNPQEFRQRSVELIPDGVNIAVAVTVPLEHGLIANAADIIKAQLDKDSKGVPAPILTPAGVKFVTDVLEAPFLVEAKSADDDFGGHAMPKRKGKVKLETNLDDESEDEGPFGDENDDEDNNDKPYQDSEEKWV